MKQKTFLLINPPIYDFAAYDLWAKPIGLLSIARILKDSGAKVHLIDCLDRLNALMPITKSNLWGCGKYYCEEVKKPEILKTIPRKYKRYGLPIDTLKKCISEISLPDAILVSSGMTYWYPGVYEAIKHIKQIFPNKPVILGGIYATICYEHAKKNSGADYVVSGGNILDLFNMLNKLNLGEYSFNDEFSNFPIPAYEFYNKLEYVAIRTTIGCLFKCSYCAIDKFSGNIWEKKKKDIVIKEITGLWQRGIKNFAFYDDGLLIDSLTHIIPIFEQIQMLGIKANFHSPNGLHAKFITPQIAKLFKQAGFVMPRLSLETSNKAIQKATSNKITNEEFICATRYLREAGFMPGEYASYIMIGMFNQNISEIEESIKFAHRQGAKIFLSEYSPIPRTKDWGIIKDKLPFDDPLWHNNSIYPLHDISDWDKIQKIKQLAKELNNCFT